MLNRYRDRLLQSIQLTDNIKDLFNYGTEQGQEKLLEAIDEGVMNGLEKALGNTPTELSELSSKARQSFNESDMSSLNTVIGYINQGIELIATKSNALSVILNNYMNGNINLSGLSSTLQNKLSLLDTEGQIIGFNNVALNTVAKSLIKLISAAESQNLTKDNISGYLNNIFSTGLGESLIAIGVARQMVNGADEIIDNLLLGTKAPIKNVTTYAQDYHSLINQTFKPDVGTDNFQIAINDQGDVINLQLGLSVKQYSSLEDKVTIVKDKPFTQILSGLFSDGKYEVYNTLGLLNDTQKQYQEMKKSILLSYADNFLTGTGHGMDFVQYIVINGKAYPAYKILKQIIDQASGTLNGDKDNDDSIAITITGVSKIAAERNKYPGRDSMNRAWERAKAINKIISGDLKIHASLSIKNLT